jgi:hypothetical protein
VRQPERGPERDVSAQEDLDQTPQPAVPARVRDPGKEEAEQRRAAEPARARLLERHPEGDEADQRQRPDAEADVAEAVERAPERREQRRAQARSQGTAPREV